MSHSFLRMAHIILDSWDFQVTIVYSRICYNYKIHKPFATGNYFYKSQNRSAVGILDKNTKKGEINPISLLKTSVPAVKYSNFSRKKLGESMFSKAR